MDTREARQLIAELELISHGTTQAFNPSGGHNAEKPDLPPGELHPPHIRLRQELAKAMSQTQVDRVAQKAREALQAARYTPRNTAELIYGTRQWREAIAADDRSVDVVAQEYGISAGHVHRLRREAA